MKTLHCKDGTPVDIRSITISWIFALSLLAIISVWSTDFAPKPANPPPIKTDLSPNNDAYLSLLDVQVSCALSQKQSAQARISYKKNRLPGAKAILSSWADNTLTELDIDHLFDCIENRLQYSSSAKPATKQPSNKIISTDTTQKPDAQFHSAGMPMLISTL